jgi:hypothetical protein
MDTALEIVNSITACYVLTELATGRRALVSALPALGAAAGINILVFLLHHFEKLPAFPIPQVSEVLAVVAPLPFCWIQTVCLSLLFVFVKTTLPRLGSHLPWNGLAYTNIFAFFVALVFHWHRAFDVLATSKVALIMSVYLVLCWVDLRPRAANTVAWAGHVAWGFVFTLVLFPVLAIVIAVAMLLATGLFEAVGLNAQLLSLPIYYGVFYGPFSAVYVLAKRRIRSARQLLPM